MGYYVQPVDLKGYFPEETIIQIAGGIAGVETLNAMQPETELRITTAISSAESHMHRHLGRFPLPVNPAPDSLKSAAAWLTLYFIYKGHQVRNALDRNLFQGEYDRETEWLEAVTEAELGLGGTTKAAGEDLGIMTSADGCDDERIFAGGNLADF